MSWEPLRFDVVVEIDREELVRVFDEVSKRLSEALRKATVNIEPSAAQGDIEGLLHEISSGFRTSILVATETQRSLTSALKELIETNRKLISKLGELGKTVPQPPATRPPPVREASRGGVTGDVEGGIGPVPDVGGSIGEVRGVFERVGMEIVSTLKSLEESNRKLSDTLRSLPLDKLSSVVSAGADRGDIARVALESSRGFKEVGEQIKRSGENLARAVRESNVEPHPIVSYLAELASGQPSSRMYRKFAEGLAEFYREVYGGGRPYLSLEGVTRLSEMLSSSGFEEFLVGLGGGRARWGFWKAFLDMSKFFLQRGFSSVLEAVRTEQTKARARGEEVDELEIIERGLKSFNARMSFFIGKMILATVGMQTLMEIIIGRLSRISGVMGAIEGMMHATYVLAIKPLADAVGLMLLPFVRSILLVTIMFYKNIGIPLIRASVKIEGYLEKIHSWLASHIGETGANVLFAGGGLVVTTLFGIYLARAIRQVFSAFFGTVLGRRLLESLPSGVKSVMRVSETGTKPFALGFPGGTAGAAVLGGVVGTVVGAELAKKLGGGTENIARGFQKAYLSSMRYAEQTRGLTSAIFTASEGLFKYSGELYRLGVQTERAGGAMHRFIGLFEEGVGLLGSMIGNLYYGAGRAAAGVEGGLRRLKVEVGLHFDRDFNLRGEVERVIRDAFSPAF